MILPCPVNRRDNLINTDKMVLDCCGGCHVQSDTGSDVSGDVWDVDGMRRDKAHSFSLRLSSKADAKRRSLENVSL